MAIAKRNQKTRFHAVEKIIRIGGQLKKLLILIAIAVAILVNPQITYADTSVYSVQRLAGNDRIDTSILASNKGWNSADTVILDESSDYADAIAATPLAVKLDAPILLTAGTSMDSRVISELQRLKVKKVILLGGEGCLTSAIEGTLNELKLPYERIGGSNRYETSTLIALRIKSDSVIIANGDDFPDALASASFAGIRQIPIILITNTLPDSVVNYLDTQKPAHVIVVGGEAVVPTNLFSEKGISIETRLGGVDRYDTSAKIYDYSKDSYTSPDIFIASGEDFPDAMVGTVVAAKNKSPLLITRPQSIPTPVYSILVTRGDPSSGSVVYILGGTAVVSNLDRKSIENIGLPVTPVTVDAGLTGKTIVIDPGHGTPDTGAIGPSGTLEKDNNLAIALILEKDLKSVGANVLMTRSTDNSPASADFTTMNDLQDRVDLANNAKADIFVSIHNDSFTNSAASGTSTYYSADNSQSDKSQQLANNVQDELINYLGTSNRGVNEAPFYVIKYTDMPAILVEAAFISNPNEEKKLANDDFRQSIATAILSGITDFIN
ncbi:MAG: N-acetylmuramoyl-L-alanine amidase [Desulfosporosinus sp.]|nr:N-acetylmuramoyl-L-alanine amidase [Desulfosporosinus sp.]